MAFICGLVLCECINYYMYDIDKYILMIIADNMIYLFPPVRYPV